MLLEFRENIPLDEFLPRRDIHYNLLIELRRNVDDFRISIITLVLLPRYKKDKYYDTILSKECEFDFKVSRFSKRYIKSDYIFPTLYTFITTFLINLSLIHI